MPGVPADRGPSGTGHDTAAETGDISRYMPAADRVTEAAPARSWNVTLYEGGFTVDADDEHEARVAALHTVAESLDLFEVEPDPPVAVPGPASVSPAEPPERVVAEAMYAQSELSWLGGFLSTALPDRPDLPGRTDRAYRAIERLIEAVRDGR